MKYTLKKLGIMLITLFFISFLIFMAFSIIPGDAALSRLGTNATPERLEALREEMGLNKPLLVQFFHWASNVVKGDFGTSYSYNMPVAQMILEKLPITICLSLMAFFVIIIVSIPLSIYAAKHENSVMDRMIIICSQISMSIPPFFLGIIITYVFGIILKIFTPGGFVNYTQNLGQFLYYLMFPAIAMAIPKIAMTVKLFRSSLLQEKRKDYVRTAYSKGNNSNQVFYNHILKNALIPVVTFLGMALTDMIAGSIIVEQVFNIPGLGRILLASISSRDFPVVEAIVLFIALLVLVVNFLVDITYHFIDPRVE